MLPFVYRHFLCARPPGRVIFRFRRCPPRGVVAVLPFAEPAALKEMDPPLSRRSPPATQCPQATPTKIVYSGQQIAASPCSRKPAPQVAQWGPIVHLTSKSICVVPCSMRRPRRAVVQASLEAEKIPPPTQQCGADRLPRAPRRDASRGASPLPHPKHPERSLPACLPEHRSLPLNELRLSPCGGAATS